MVFLDISQGFGKVWHYGMLHKLKQLLPAPYYLLYKSYLNKRSFYVQVNGDDSLFEVVKFGISQGIYTIFNLSSLHQIYLQKTM